MKMMEIEIERERVNYSAWTLTATNPKMMDLIKFGC